MAVAAVWDRAPTPSACAAVPDDDTTAGNVAQAAAGARHTALADREAAGVSTATAGPAAGHTAPRPAAARRGRRAQHDEEVTGERTNRGSVGRADEDHADIR